MMNVTHGPSTTTRPIADGISAPMLRIYTFGTLQVVRDDYTVTESDWHTRQARQLLKILITERPQPVSTDRLIDLLWPDSAPNAAATTLRSAINALRNVLEPERRSRAPSKYIITQTPGYAFHHHVDIWLDVEYFATLLGRSEVDADPANRIHLLNAAINLYQDDYLTSDPYVDWAQNERERLRERYFTALLTVAELYATAGNHTSAIAACRRIITRDPVRESAYQALMRYQAESGDSASALLTYERCRALLAEELGADPSPLTQAWHQQILNGEIGPHQIRPVTQQSTITDQPRAILTSPEMETAVSNVGKLVLPVQQLNLLRDRLSNDTAADEQGEARFVGRTAELTLLTRQVAQAKLGKGSLCLLDGEVGVGKTHLAFHLIQQMVGPELTVIHTTCQPLEHHLPFAPLSDGLGRFLHTLTNPMLRALPSTSLAQLAQLIPSLQGPCARVVHCDG